jgi:ABC-type phosphate/phosphonate transport system permease subunit
LIKSIIIFFIILTNVTFAEIKKITIVGNARVSSATIESLFDKKIIKIDTKYINNLNKKIYDKDFFMGPFAATASGTPNVKRPSAEDDGTRNITPPHFYPFHEFD